MSGTFQAAGRLSCRCTDFRTTRTSTTSSFRICRRPVAGPSHSISSASALQTSRKGPTTASNSNLVTWKRSWTLGLEKIIPIGHDAGGPAAVNFALRHPTRAAGICLMNAFYGESPGLRVPEFIELFGNKNLKALTRHLLATQFAWLLDLQRGQWRAGMTEAQKTHYNEFIVPIVDKNFTQRPSAVRPSRR